MNTDIKAINATIQCTIESLKSLTPTAFILRLQKNFFSFRAGQYLVISLPGKRQMREYSIYSGEQENFIEILVKEIKEGYLSGMLKQLKPGDNVGVQGPFGYFVTREEERNSKKFIFIASGTGISPFHSFIKTYPRLNYTLLHGVRYASEGYGKEDYSPQRYVLCTSKDNSGNFNGRVTDYLLKNPVDLETICYICGNSAMIDDVYDILTAKGIPPANIRMEVYF